MASSDASAPPVIVVTGSSRGLGRAIALRCGRAGWRVVVHCRTRRAEAEAVAKAIIEAGGRALVLQADVTIPGTFPQIVEQTVTHWGRIDAWVNNAGVVDDRLVVSTPDDAWDRVIATDLTAAWRATQAVAPVMARQRGGAILNVSSIAALQGRRGQSAYSAAKAGLIAFTRSSARELGPDNIRVNAVCPPVLDTESVGATAETLREQQLIPGVISPEDAADTMFSILSLPWISGQIFVMDSRIPAGTL
ncbi:MAG: SDR family NAD(P)-dependent oxidoreductase [Nitrospirota bacterium]